MTAASPRAPTPSPAPVSSFRWTRSQVEAVLGPPAVLPRARSGEPFRAVSTDTRTLEPGDLWIALSGPRFDGNDFAARALELGAAGLVLRRDPAGPGGLPPGLAGLSDGTAAPTVPVWLVDEPLGALGRLGRARRDVLDVPVVAITGSTGKTTTKGYLRAALEALGPVHATPQNQNNRVGVPRTLLDTPAGVGAVVLELGTSEPGEIRALTAIADPDVAVLTTVDATHLEGLGSVAGVMEEKLDLVRGLRPDVPLVVGDAPGELAERVRALRPGAPLDVAGLGGDTPWAGRVTGVDETGRPTVAFSGPDGWTATAALPLPGRAPAVNAVLALAAAARTGVAPGAALTGLLRAGPEGLRGRIRTVGGVVLVEDCYNANPRSTRAALELLAELPARGRRIAVLGSMLELGEASDTLHRELLAHARSLEPTLDLLVLVGAFVAAGRAAGGEAAPEAPEELHASSAAGAAALLEGRLRPGDVLLLKGSRGVRLEEVSRWLEDTRSGEEA